MPITQDLAAPAVPEQFSDLTHEQALELLCDKTNALGQLGRMLDDRDVRVRDLQDGIVVLNRMMSEAADFHEMCGAYDEFIDNLNSRIAAFQLEPRHLPHQVVITLRVDYDGVDPALCETEIRRLLYVELDGHPLWDEAHVELRNVTIGSAVIVDTSDE